MWQGGEGLARHNEPGFPCCRSHDAPASRLMRDANAPPPGRETRTTVLRSDSFLTLNSSVIERIVFEKLPESSFLKSAQTSRTTSSAVHSSTPAACRPPAT